jgi:hypothetical protein
MTNDIQTECTTREKTSPGRRLHRVALSLILLLAIVAAVGCNGIGRTDSRLARSWNSGPSSLLLNADGTYVMTLKGSVTPNTTITNESGKWGVKDERLSLQNDKSASVLIYRYKLNDKGDQLELTLDSPLNPNGVTVTYRSGSN